MSFRFSKRIEVRFRDCDPFGHVNNAVFATYFEIARFSYCREALGYSEAESPLFIMARVECNYRSQARVGELLDVQLRLSRIGHTSFTFEYRVVEATDGRVVADGSSVQVMFDYAGQRSVAVSEDFRVRAARFEQADFAVGA